MFISMEKIIYSNDLSFEKKKVICKKLDSLFYAGFYDYRDIDVVKDLSFSIKDDAVLSEKQIKQVNYLLGYKLCFRIF